MTTTEPGPGDKCLGDTSLPGASQGHYNNGHLTSRVLSRQSGQHRLSLTITGHYQSQHWANTLFHTALRPVSGIMKPAVQISLHHLQTEEA